MKASSLAQTLDLLETRLARVEFFLNKDVVREEEDDLSEDKQNTESVTARLARIENRFRDLCSKSQLVSELLTIRFKHPDIFPSEYDPNRAEDNLTPAQKRSIVNASASSYQEVASDLNVLKESQVPDTKSLIPLITPANRLAKIEHTQQQQVEEVAELRQRSADVVAQWYQNIVLNGGEQWSDWESRMASLEQTSRRQEKVRKREQEEL